MNLYQKDVLSNGLTVIRVPMKGVKSITAFALVGTGSRFEDERTSGISHFLEHMVFKGTNKYPTARELSSVVDEVGAEFNAFTSKEYTGYYVKSASENAVLAIDVVSDMLLTPKLRSEDLEREKGVIVEEMHMYEDTPVRYIGDVFERMMFAGSSLGRDIIGTEETVRAFKREDFVEHLKHWYGLKNVCFVIAGDEAVVSDEAVFEQIKRSFAKQEEERETQSTQIYINQLSGSPLATDKRILVHNKETQQAHFILAFPGLSRRDEDRYALSVLSTLLGGNMSSRLFTRVREELGLCYYVRADEDFYHETGIFGASAGVDVGRIDEAVKVVREQMLLLLDDTGKDAITEEEVVKAISHEVGSTVLSFEDSQAVAQVYGMSHILHGEVETIEAKLNKLKAVTFEDVKKVAKRLIDPNSFYFSIIGPYQDEERFRKIIEGK